MPPIITLTTDFGARDAYAGAMKGAILDVNADARIVDITHDVPPQDIVEGAWVLASAFRYFPPDTVHVAVVDPGVGSQRRAVAARAGAWWFVGPDNGVLAWAVAAAGLREAVELADPRWFRDDVSATFHGRDVFAPVAAHIASGVGRASPLAGLGPRVEALAPLPVPQPRADGDRLRCEVIHVDRFGNAITNLDRATYDAWSAGASVSLAVAGRNVGAPRRAYADAPPGAPLALFGSTAHLEIAVRDASAARTLGLTRGSPIDLTRT